MSEKYVKIKNLSISQILYNFINKEALPGTNIEEEKFWTEFDKSVHELLPKNRELLNIRHRLQMDIDRWHLNNKDKELNIRKYENFLKKIGYLNKVGSNFTVKTKNVDDEIGKIAGPQLVVPIMNARYALNATNARWMSLYDSLYGTDVIQSEESASERYDPERGLEVINYTKKFLDDHFSLNNNRWKKVNKIKIINNNLSLETYKQNVNLKDKEKFIGFRGTTENPSAVILKNNSLHVEIIINPNAFSAKSDAAGISDIILESAISTICDHEDSVAAVDAVLVNTAIAQASKPYIMAKAFKLGVEAGRNSYLAGRIQSKPIASASSPEINLIDASDS